MRTRLGIILVAGLSLAPAPMVAQSWSIAPRYLLNWGGPGTYAGDINGWGLALARRMDAASRWEVRLTWDHLEYDLEVPLFATDLEPGDPEPVDGFGRVERAQVDVARYFRTDAVWQPFVHAGAGIYSIDMTEIDGVTDSGDPYHLVTETPTTGGVTIGVGSDVRASTRLALSLGFSYSQTFSEYTVTDTESGETGTIAPFAPLGLAASVGWRF